MLQNSILPSCMNPFNFPQKAAIDEPQQNTVALIYSLMSQDVRPQYPRLLAASPDQQDDRQQLLGTWRGLLQLASALSAKVSPPRGDSI